MADPFTRHIVQVHREAYELALAGGMRPGDSILPPPGSYARKAFDDGYDEGSRARAREKRNG